MIQTILLILRDAQTANRRVVIMVPESAYEEALRALGCAYPDNTGRSALMPNGHLVSVMTPDTPVSEAGEKFVMYLSGWGKATPKDERLMLKWTEKAQSVVNEIS